MGLHVSLKAFPKDESFATHKAINRLLPSVISPLHGKVGQVRETISTPYTIIWLTLYMLLLMVPQ